MIITLKDANFSENNIGNLDSWSITKILRGVSTDDTTTRIKKGNTGYEATFTVNDGYSLDVFNVTMGEEDITHFLVWEEDNKTATLEIFPEVTGNVYITIKALRENIGGGEEDDDDINTKLISPYIEAIVSGSIPAGQGIGKVYSYTIQNKNNVSVTLTGSDNNDTFNKTLAANEIYMSDEEIHASDTVYITAEFNATNYQPSSTELTLEIWTVTEGEKITAGGE